MAFRYLKRFLNLNCAPDVMESCWPVKNMHVEVEEAMRLVEHIKSIVECGKKEHYNIIEFCSGNALASSLAAHLLPIKKVIAIHSRKKAKDGYKKIHNFQSKTMNILTKEGEEHFIKMLDNLKGPAILISAHPCKEIKRKLNELKTNQWNVALVETIERESIDVVGKKSKEKGGEKNVISTR